MAEPKPSRFSESRPILPFRISTAALGQTGFRIRPDVEFSKSDPWQDVLEPEQIRHELFSPAFELNVDAEALSADSGVAMEDAVLAVVMRDPALLRRVLVTQWRVGETPDTFAVPATVLQSISGQRGIEFVLQITPARTLKTRFRTASRPGHIIASRGFSVAIPSEGDGFPVQTVEKSHFKQLGLPEETVWIIRWNTTEDFDRPAEDVLCVIINKDEAERILRLSAGDGVGSVLWAEIAAEIFLEICLVVFSNDPEPPKEEDSLLAKLIARMHKETALELQELIGKAQSGVDGYRFFRAHLQKSFELGDRIRRISLAGRSS